MILVTGATGNIGPNVVRSLLACGIDVRAGIHVKPLDIDGIETCTIDFDRPETLPSALEGVHSLFLLSSEVVHEEAMVAAARDAGIERIIYVSSFRADTDHFLVGQLHRRTELQIEASGMQWTFLAQLSDAELPAADGRRYPQIRCVLRLNRRCADHLLRRS